MSSVVPQPEWQAPCLTDKTRARFEIYRGRIVFCSLFAGFELGGES